jgi:hypothetical protein
MTVNWERESGERIEEFAAAYILLRAGRGNQIRPSQGDHGIDVQVPSPEGWEIYQVKRFATSLDSSSKRQIKESWERFRDDVLPKRAVKSWSLVLPLEPTPQNEQWLEELTRGSGIETRWIGRATLDGWAATSPKLTDYFFGDGGRRLHDLMSLAFSGAQPLAEDDGEPLLTSIQDRMTSLSRALDEIDPFYRYEIEVRTGNLQDVDPAAMLAEPSRPGLAESVMEQINDDQYLITHVIARSAVSDQLRPISGTIRFKAETPAEVETLERWFHYGAPLSEASASIVRSEGPPGTTSPPGSVATAWTISPVADDHLPPLEVRLRDGAGCVVKVVPVTATASSAAVRGDGQWLRAELGPAATIEYFFGAAGRDDVVTITSDRAVGAAPDDVAATIDLIASLPDHALELAVRNGPVLMPARGFEGNDLSIAAVSYGRFVQALSVVQQHTYSRVTIPEVPDPNGAETKNLLRLASLLSGQEVSGTFTEYQVRGDDEFFRDWDEKARKLITEERITIHFAGAVWETDMNLRNEFETVWLDRSVEPPVLRAGESNKVRSVAVAPK